MAGLKIAEDCTSLNRSKQHAFLIVIGLSGTGKSSTMNTLFDRRALGDADEMFDSATQHVLEYNIKVTATNRQEEVRHLRIIDTPGFHDVNDKDPQVKDSQILATIQSYIEDHADLRDRFPTAVLLVAKFTDDTIFDENSFFVKLLKALEYRIIDNEMLIDTSSKTCNLVLVLTHFQGASDGDKRLPEGRIRQFKNLIWTFTSISCDFPVVLAENKGKDFDLPQVNGNSELVNGELYPQNLFLAIQNVAQKGGDKTGNSILTDALEKDPLRLRKTLHSKMDLVPRNNRLASEYFYFFKHPPSLPRSKHAIEDELQAIWGYMSPNDTDGNGLYLQIVKQAFVKEGICCKQDVPKTINDTLRFLSRLPFPNPSYEILLNEIGLVAPKAWACVNVIGTFYDIKNATLGTYSPFVYEYLSITRKGFAAPPHIQIENLANLKYRERLIIEILPTIDAYESERLRTWGIRSTLPGTKLVNEVLPGFTIGKDENTDTIVGVKEYRMHYTYLTECAKLKHSYVNQVEALEPVDDFHSKSAWKQFFSQSGTQVVSAAFLGGYVKLTATRIKSRTDIWGVKTSSQIRNLVTEILSNIGKSDNFTVHNDAYGWSFQLEYFGGDPSIKPGRFLPTVFCPAGKSKVVDWIYSLHLNPVFLPTEIKLAPVSQFVKNPSLQEKLSAAIRTVERLY